jgi:protein-disulfide isomerase
VKPLTVLFALAALALADISPEKSVGPKTAPIMIDLFSDFQCPGCKILHDETLSAVINDFVKPGKVVIVYHDFPLPIHSHAREAARWANAAATVHKYRQVGDAFFKTQESWARSGDLKSVVATVLTPAEMTKVEALMKDPSFDDGVSKDIALGTKAGLQGTPTMVITHKLQSYNISKPISYQIFRKMLDDLATK